MGEAWEPTAQEDFIKVTDFSVVHKDVQPRAIQLLSDFSCGLAEINREFFPLSLVPLETVVIG